MVFWVAVTHWVNIVQKIQDRYTVQKKKKSLLIRMASLPRLLSRSSVFNAKLNQHHFSLSAIQKNAVAATAAETKAEAAAQRAERTMKRFWKKVGIKKENDEYMILLDQRSLRTPGNNVMRFPVTQYNLALLTAAEWDAQTENLKAHTLPLTSIIARAIDAFGSSNPGHQTLRSDVIDKLMTYFDTDATCYFEEGPDVLVDLQEQYWRPIHKWAQETYGVHVESTTSIFASTQPKDTKIRLRKEIEAMDDLELSAFEKGVLSSKSFLVGLALVKGAVSVEHASQAAHVEMNAQMHRWGQVEDSHDVEHEYIRQTLGSVACSVMHKY
ncbi:hypothetical protein BDF14DRAFT_1777780 [Spinellus fusiger]|nr:hypothetical protein BDF14DRAFT_1777780 [Spinellus fusiger]